MTTTGPDSGPGGGPTVLRMLLGAHLRRLREAQGVTREDAGWEIRSSDSKISRMELGRVSFKERDVADLLTLYGVSDSEERDRLLALARDANTRGWWHRFGDVLAGWFQFYLGLEAAANLIRTYEVQFIPGLLQTQEYARAVVMLGHGRATGQEVDAGSTCVSSASRRSAAGPAAGVGGHRRGRAAPADRRVPGAAGPDAGAHRRDRDAQRSTADPSVRGRRARRAPAARSRSCASPRATCPTSSTSSS